MDHRRDDPRLRRAAPRRARPQRRGVARGRAGRRRLRRHDKTALADAQTRQANNLAALASFQAQMAQRQLDLPQPSGALSVPQPSGALSVPQPTGALSLPQPSGQNLSALLQRNAQLQQALLEAIDDLTRAIKKLREEFCPRPPCGPR